MTEVRAEIAKELYKRYWEMEKEKMLQFISERQYFERILDEAKEGGVEVGIDFPRIWADMAIGYFIDLGYRVLDDNYYAEKDGSEWCQFYVSWEERV